MADFIIASPGISFMPEYSGNGVISNNVFNNWIPAIGLVVVIDHLPSYKLIASSRGTAFHFGGLATSKDFLVVCELDDRSKHPLAQYVRPQT